MVLSEQATTVPTPVEDDDGGAVSPSDGISGGTATGPERLLLDGDPLEDAETTPEPFLPSPTGDIEPTSNEHRAGGGTTSIVGAVPLVIDGDGNETPPSEVHGPEATTLIRADFDLPESAQQHNPTKPGEAKEASPSRPAPNRKKWWFAGLGVVVVVIVIVLGVALGGGAPPPVPETGLFADFSTGVSLVTEYHVDCRVHNRLAQTTIKLEVANALNCSSIHSLSLQLPLNTRIASLETSADEGECTTVGRVQHLEQARETFLESASQGLPGAYVEARASATRTIQVSIPPFGKTRVTLVVEQLLQQRLGEVEFELPLAPNEDVDDIKFDLSVEDTDGKPALFEVDLDVPGVYVMDENATQVLDPISLSIPDARQYKIPKVLSGKFKPSVIEERGYLYTDGRCFEHYFRPATVDSMRRNLIFLIDTSGSMKWQNKLAEAKIALAQFVDTLRPDETFTIQAFGSKGTEDLWGSAYGTDEEKSEAKKFIENLRARGWDTNLHEAYLEALLRAKHDAENSDDDVVTILVTLSDAYATRGETNRRKIAKHIFDLNSDRSVKIFNIGFRDSADMQLLDAIALMNGGLSSPIVQGRDFSDQIGDFLQSELGEILLSDVRLSYETTSGARVYGETQNSHTLLADGYEVVTRGLIESDESFEHQLEALTQASTTNGSMNWKVSATPTVEESVSSSLCFQSYASDRITQLMRLYDAAEFIGDYATKQFVVLKNDCKSDKFRDCVKQEALDLAIEANLVVKGLTAMVTVDEKKCAAPDEDAEICVDGTSPDGVTFRPSYSDKSEEEAAYEDHEASMPMSESAPMAMGDSSDNSRNTYYYSASWRLQSYIALALAVVSSLLLLV